GGRVGPGGGPGGGPEGGGPAGGGRGGMQPPGQQGNGQQGAPRQGNGQQGAPRQGNGQQGAPQQGNSQTQPGGIPGGGALREGGPGGGMGGGMGGLLNGANVDAETKAALLENAEDYTWVAAAIGSQNQASYQLATERPVMSIGGFNGSDPSPTLAQFKRYVADGRIHYFVGGGMGGGGMGGGNGTAAQISEWVQDNFEQVTVGDSTLYDLTEAKG
ncbi:glycosyl transferase, partial [Streptomyces mesophilus]